MDRQLTQKSRYIITAMFTSIIVEGPVNATADGQPDVIVMLAVPGA
jgi:hypothetical protein